MIDLLSLCQLSRLSCFKLTDESLDYQNNRRIEKINSTHQQDKDVRRANTKGLGRTACAAKGHRRRICATEVVTSRQATKRIGGVHHTTKPPQDLIAGESGLTRPAQDPFRTVH
jgi:hypothetical protein